MNKNASNLTTNGVNPQNNSQPDEGKPTGKESAEKKMNLRIDQPEQLAAPYQLPAFRELQKLMDAIKDEEGDFTNFCDAVGDVPQVKKLILRDAGSILSSRGNRIDSIKHAVAMLGVRRIRSMLNELAKPYRENINVHQSNFPNEEIRVSA